MAIKKTAKRRTMKGGSRGPRLGQTRFTRPPQGAKTGQFTRTGVYSKGQYKPRPQRPVQSPVPGIRSSSYQAAIAALGPPVQ